MGEEEARVLLAGLLAPDRTGFRRCVPVVGSGVNLQAAQMDGAAEDDWAGLLQRIARELGLAPRVVDTLPRPHLFRWESMLHLWARIKRVQAFQAEADLQNLTCEYLRSLERRVSGRRLYRELACARFSDILSLNFDRRIALSSPKCRLRAAPSPCPQGVHGETLYRHDFLQSDAGTTRIWYPHGDTKKPTTLKLGIRKYGFYVGVIEETFTDMNSHWRSKGRYGQVRDRIVLSDPTASRWTDVFLSRPLVFIGCSLSRDEWPLWSMLRRRVAQRERLQQAAYFASGAPIDDDQRETLARQGVELLAFSSHDRMWDSIRAAIG
jgi:hypothetical protein